MPGLSSRYNYLGKVIQAPFSQPRESISLFSSACKTKCCLFQKEVKFLGRIISKEGVSVDPKNKDHVQQWPEPKSKCDVATVISFVNYYREHVPNLSKTAASLHSLKGTTN